MHSYVGGTFLHVKNTVKFLKIWTPENIAVITLKFEHRVMRPKDVDRMANSVDPIRLLLIWVYTVCSGLSSENLGSWGYQGMAQILLPPKLIELCLRLLFNPYSCYQTIILVKYCYTYITSCALSSTNAKFLFVLRCLQDFKAKEINPWYFINKSFCKHTSWPTWYSFFWCCDLRPSLQCTVDTDLAFHTNR